jgi:starch-binding outer membrane protein SusE/F
MKLSLKISSLLLIASAAMISSCTKDEVKAVLTPGGATNLTASQTTIILLQANAANPAVTFSWNKAEFGFPAAINYTLELTRGGTNFATATTTTVPVQTALTKGFTVGEFNQKMQDIIPNGVATQVQARVKADVGSNVAPIYSNVVNMTITAYKDIVNYEFPFALRVAGNFQGWSPGTAPKLVDKFAAGSTGAGYEGYINLTDANPEFKLVKGNDWPAGDFGSAGPGLLGNGGPNLSVVGGAGVYRIRANTVAMTWSYTKITTWGIIGSATPGDWGSSTPMVFNPGDGTWSITVDLVGGAGRELKFRANNDWPINFGDNAPADGKPEYDGNNIPIPLSGNYTIILDIGIAGNYSYSIRRN